MTNSTLQEQKILKVIIIEDYKLTRVGLKSALQEFDFLNVVGEAENALNLSQMVKSLEPDVILMDLGLPELNGIEATLMIKEEFPQIKVIALTSHEREEEVIASIGAGASAYCLKDISPYTLAEVIKDVANGACWLDAGVSKVIYTMFPKPENVNLLPSQKISDVKNQLTEREYEVLKLLVQGKSNAEIAENLIVSVHTAKAHVCSILQKLCVDDRVQAAVKAIKENIV
ncbi:response regulator transcription factor [bacterium]|nr:response regulator transcription factor [bacterium]